MSAGLAGIILLVLGVVVFVALLVGFILFVVSRVQRAAIARIEAEGIERRSGSCAMTIRLRNYRSPQIYASSQTSRKYGELLLVRDALVVLSVGREVRFAFPDTDVKIEEGRLVLETDKPKGASGWAKISASAPDPESWLRELRERGARA
jgi:hypothetical protein